MEKAFCNKQSLIYSKELAIYTRFSSPSRLVTQKFQTSKNAKYRPQKFCTMTLRLQSNVHIFYLVYLGIFIENTIQWFLDLQFHYWTSFD